MLNKLQSDNVNVASTIQSMQDNFAIATKALDQTGRSRAFHHIIWRKAAASDTGLNNLRKVQAKVLYLPLSGDGVFGCRLQEHLRKRKEQKELLSDLVPEFAENKSDWRTRKSAYNSRSSWSKRPRMTPSPPPERSFRSRYHTQSSSPLNDERKYDDKGKNPKEPSSYFGSLSTIENDSKVNIGLQSPKIPVGGRPRFFLQNW